MDGHLNLGFGQEIFWGKKEQLAFLPTFNCFCLLGTYWGPWLVQIPASYVTLTFPLTQLLCDANKKGSCTLLPGKESES